MAPKKPTPPFHFKQFSVEQDRCTMKVGTDAVLLGAWAHAAAPKKILDIGAGTGVISIMLAQRFPQASVTGVEIDQSSHQQASENMAAAPWADRLEVQFGAIQDFASQTNEKYDLIVSNPPFFSGGTFSHNQNRNEVRHTVKLSHADLLRSVQKLLAPNGVFSVVLPFIEGLRFQELAKVYHLYPFQMLQVKPKADKPVERLLISFSYKKEASIEEESLIIQHEKRNDWTQEYIDLTGDFYLKM